MPTTTTTTTTTTTRPPRHTVLKKVETIIVLPNNETTIKQDGSDSKATTNTINSKALEIGPLAPGEASQTKIIYLRVPSSIGINNIKIALIDTGGVEFQNNIFGVETLSHLDYNYVPSSFFQGVNSDKSANNAYNVDVPVNGPFQSQYVYLHVNLKLGQLFQGGTIRYKWFFDYDSGVSSTSGAIGSGGSGVSGIGAATGLGSVTSEQKDFPSSYIVSGSSNANINGTYTLRKETFTGDKDDVSINNLLYTKQGLIPAQDLGSGYNGLIADLSIYGLGRTPVEAVLTFSDYAVSEWCPECVAPLASQSWAYYPTISATSTIPTTPPEIWADFDGKTFTQRIYNGTNDSDASFPANPYIGDTLTITAIYV